jgi:hypothetical protein
MTTPTNPATTATIPNRTRTVWTDRLTGAAATTLKA